jgi:23S rRNA pseudouridine2605 synthase
MLFAIGLPVTRLIRVRFGPVRLGSLAPGTTRELSPAEVRALYRVARL